MPLISNIGSEQIVETEIKGGLRVALFTWAVTLPAVILGATLAAGLTDSHVRASCAKAALP
jgi:hypothetical protein